ncbi:putative pyridoxine 5'-phosphate oxidase superfamily flavin-nucleotide-binding protein [Sinorhizobium fredii]|uniref:pyridoxamine 5'-phosphate oxidase family protein n=1 Tax=Rhizobium fredii TaxID=380 RepID=UPI0035114B51
MTLSLLDLEACFEGVVPSIIATADGNGVPNISYLSHVARVDDEHVALSNQFFGKTSANIRMNPRATLIVVDASNGAQFRLELTFAYSLDAGPLFDHLSLQLDATSAQVGMAGVMRLRGLDVFRVLRIEAARSTIEPERKASPQRNRLAAAAHVVDLIAAETDAEGIVDATLNGLKTWLGFEHGLFLALCEERQQLVTIGSLGYAPSGIGSEVEVGDGVIGAAAASGNIVKVSDMSRIRRFNAAVRDSSSEENRNPVDRGAGHAGCNEPDRSAACRCRHRPWRAVLREPGAACLHAGGRNGAVDHRSARGAGAGLQRADL